jgi:hypothetical protein
MQGDNIKEIGCWQGALFALAAGKSKGRENGEGEKEY